MVHNTRIPAPLQRKILITAVIGIVCFIVGFAVFLFLKDQTTMFLSLTVLAMCLGQAISIYRIASTEAYEVVEGTCIAVATKPLRKYHKIAILDRNGNELSLLLDKHTKIKIGYQYRFYFKETDRLTLGKAYFDSAVNADCFLGFEETGVFVEA